MMDQDKLALSKKDWATLKFLSAKTLYSNTRAKRYYYACLGLQKIQELDQAIYLSAETQDAVALILSRTTKEHKDPVIREKGEKLYDLIQEIKYSLPGVNKSLKPED